MTIDEQWKHIEDKICYKMIGICDDGYCKDNNCPVMKIHQSLTELKKLREEKAGD